MVLVSDIKTGIDATLREVVEKAAAKLGLGNVAKDFAHINKVSVDARKGNINFVYSVSFDLPGDLLARVKPSQSVSVRPEKKIVFREGEKKLSSPPVICGFGPRGMMCALALAKRGYRPVVIEQGQDVDRRIDTVKKFNREGILNPLSNVQFGEGGRGAFSDGKLNTGISDERCRYVINTFIRHGAPEDIAFAAKPHVGTDLLAGVIKNIRKEIIALGGTVLFDTALTGICLDGEGRVSGLQTSAGYMPAQALVLAAGHSASGLFDILAGLGAAMEAKPFSVGLRIEHLQKDIDAALYHDAAGDPRLPPGRYNLSFKNGGRGVYTFCMCPGGYLCAAASGEGGVVTNGMSYHARDGVNANSAIAVSVRPEDFGGDYKKAIAFQRDLEKKAYKAGGGGYSAPRQNVGAFMEKRSGLEIGRVRPTYPRGVRRADFDLILPGFVTDGIRGAIADFDRKIKGFAAPDGILTGVETRTSSPVRILRGGNMQSNIGGVFPAGEGAGYAGGIMSARVDGVRIAQRICSLYKPFE